MKRRIIGKYVWFGIRRIMLAWEALIARGTGHGATKDYTSSVLKYEGSK